VRGGGVVFGMCSICAEGGAGSPALGREHAVAKPGGVVGPGGILGIIGDASAAWNHISCVRACED